MNIDLYVKVTSEIDVDINGFCLFENIPSMVNKTKVDELMKHKRFKKLVEDGTIKVDYERPR